ncbi:MAG: gamma-glutamyltransferase [Bryobacteraceae bacterium]|nr:gamma-glutamyltransferase [Bryobacteraceae bacterium]
MRRRKILFIATALTLMQTDSPAQSRDYARSMTISQGGIVATSQTLASQAGAMILARGGSAVDAAIAANLVLGVVEPMMCGIGGDLFVIHRDARTGKLTGLNASGPAPRGLSLETLAKAGINGVPSSGIHTVTVPGAVRGFAEIHRRFGKLPWKDLFQPAIYFAENGFPVTELIQWDWDASRSKLMGDANATAVFLKDGQAPRVGEIFRNPRLAAAYRSLAAEGPDSFYRGALAQAILKTSRRLGGFLSAEDLASFEVEWVQPVSVDYRGWKVSQLPPNGQGIGTLEMLNIMENFPLNQMMPYSADALHVKIEAQKLAYQDQRRYIADPRVSAVPTAGLLSKAYAKERARSIDYKKADCDPVPGNPPRESGNTIYLAAIDRDGNIVSWIQSISDIFGSGVVVDGYGFHLHDRAAAFSSDPNHPNVLKPGKRPYHTIIPGFLQKDARHIGFGIMRGMNQPQAQAQFVSYVVDHNMNIQQALEAPRFSKISLGGCDVRMERRVPATVRDELEKRGHWISDVGDFSGLMGGGQAVSLDSSTGVKYGASSPRKDGAAIPEPENYFQPAVTPKKSRGK